MSRPPRPVAEPEAIRDPLRPAVVLVHPQEEGNVGATARAMANLGLDRLILVEPAVEIGDVALARAVGARHVLLQAHRAASLEEALAPFHRAVGTTSTRDRNLPSPIGPRDQEAQEHLGPRNPKRFGFSCALDHKGLLVIEGSS